MERKKWLFCWSLFPTKRRIDVHVSRRLVAVNLYASAFCPIKVRQSEVQAQTRRGGKVVHACDYSVIQPIIAGFHFCHEGFIQRHPPQMGTWMWCEGFNYERLAQPSPLFLRKKQASVWERRDCCWCEVPDAISSPGWTRRLSVTTLRLRNHSSESWKSVLVERLRFTANRLSEWNKVHRFNFRVHSHLRFIGVNYFVNLSFNRGSFRPGIYRRELFRELILQ